MPELMTQREGRPFDTMTDGEWEAWLREHGKSIGGSQIGAILGVSSYGTACDVYDPIVSLQPRSIDNANMRRGRVMEPHIADEYQAATGRSLYEQSTVIHPTDWWRRASVDRMIRAAGSGHTHEGVLEIKCLGAHTFRQTRMEGIDPSYYAQLQWYLDVCDRTWGAFAVFNADEWALFHFDIERDDAYIERMREAAYNFWHDHVLARRRPDEVDVAQEAARAARDPQLQPRAGSEWRRIEATTDPVTLALASLRTATHEKMLADQRHALAQTRVKELLDERGIDRVITPAGRVSYTTSTSTRFDKAAFERAHPDIDLAPYHRATVTRTFRPTFD